MGRPTFIFVSNLFVYCKLIFFKIFVYRLCAHLPNGNVAWPLPCWRPEVGLLSHLIFHFCVLFFRPFLPNKMGILEKISEIEKEIARTQKNKGLRMLLLLTQVCDFNALCVPGSYRIPFGSLEGEIGKVSFPTFGTIQESWGERRRLWCTQIRRCQSGINWIPICWQGVRSSWKFFWVLFNTFPFFNSLPFFQL